MHSNGFRYLKKTLCIILTIQLICPPSVLMAMQRDDEPVLSSSVRSLLLPQREVSRLLLTKKLKALYQAQDTLPKLVEEGSVPEQRMEDYHVKLQIVLNSQKEVQEKQSIVLSQMFEKVGDEDAAGHVLVTGVAGIGKTTFLNHMTYEWSQGNVFKETFETIFKIRLRSLLDDSLAQELSTEYTQEDRLAALIQRSIEQQQQELKTLREAKSQVSLGSSASTTIIGSTESIDSDVSAFSPVSLEEIKTVDRTRAVLLLDGYDEIEHLNRGGHVVTDLMRSVFKYPNVVLTSRPNAVTSALENRFERKIEAVGLGSEEVSQYIQRYFSYQSRDLVDEVAKELSRKKPSHTLFQSYEKQENPKSKEILATLEAIEKHREKKQNRGLGETLEDLKESIEAYYTDVEHSLSHLYRDNPILRETLTTPINLAMICLIATDPNILRRFVGDFNIGQLYEGVVVWLGKRYLTKFKEKDATEALDAIDIMDERILHLEELLTLEQVAYKEFKVNKTVVSGKKLDELAREMNRSLGIRQVNKYGLMKPEATRPLYSFEVCLHGIPEDQEVKPSKFYLYTDKTSLFSAAQKRGEIERIDLTAAPWLSDTLKDSIRTSLNKKTRDLKVEDRKALFSVLLSKDYEVVEEPSNTKGVSKEAVEAQDLINRYHRFIHLSFQEYLTAHKLKELLQQEDIQVVRDVAQFIGEHRNDPRYLMTLKFLAGIVSKEQDDSEGDNNSSSSITPLVTRFWDAVTCNVDGILELGLETKVSLRMHLLSQSKKDGKFDDRNPHLPTLTKLIDEVVLKDIVHWEEKIIQSGYLSESIVDHLKAILTGFQGAGQAPEGELDEQRNRSLKAEEYTLSAIHEAYTQALKTAIEVITSLINRSELGGRGAVFSLLMQLVERTEDWQVKKLSLKKLEQIIDQTLPEASLQDCLTTSVLLLKDNTFAHDVSDLLAKIIKTTPHLSEELFSLLTPLLKHPSENIRQVAVLSLGTVGKATPVLIPEVFPLFVHFLQDSSYYVREAAAKSLSEAVKMVPEVALHAFSLFEPLLQDSDSFIREAATESWEKMVEAAPAVAPHVLSLLTPLLQDSGYVRCVAISSLGAVVKAAPDMAPEVLPLLEPLLQDSYWGVREEAARILGDIVKVAPELASQALPLLTPLLKDSEYKTWYSVIKSLVEMVKAAPAVTSQALSLLEPLLKDSEGYVRQNATVSLRKMVELAPTLAPEVLFLLAPLLQDSEIKVREATAENLGEVVKAAPALAHQALPLFAPLLKDSERDVRKVASKSLGEVVKAAPEVAPQALPLLAPLLKDSERDVRQVAASSLGEMVEAMPAVAFQGLSLLAPLLQDSDKGVSWGAASSLRGMLRAAPEIAPEGLSRLEALLQNFYGDVRENATRSLGAVVTASPALVSQVFSLLPPLLQDSSLDVRKAIAQSLGEVVEAAPAVASHVLSLLTPLLQDSYWDARTYAVRSLGKVVEVAPALVLQAFSLLEPLLKDSFEDVRRSAVRILGKVVEAAPAITPQAFSLLESSLKDSDSWVRQYAIESLGEIAITVPEMAQDILTLLESSLGGSQKKVIKKIFEGLPLDILASFLSQQWKKTETRSMLEDTLLSKLKLFPIESLSHNQLLPLFTIIGLTRSLEDTKDLTLAAQKVLKQLASTLDDAGVAWINAHFYQLPNLPERQAFLKDIYHTILKRGHIAEEERDFIINCIQNGLTTTITRSGTIILEGVTYELAPDSKQHLSAITQEALSQQDNKLSEQYRNYQPLFRNNRVGLRIAASDIAHVPSLAGTDSLSGGCWRLTLLTLDTSSLSFVLLEKRNRFGDRIAQKFNTQGQALTPKHVCHPEETTRAFRESLFGARTFSTHEAQSILLSEDKKRELFFEGTLSGMSTLDPQAGTSETWDDFKTRLFTQTAKRYSLPHDDLLGIDSDSPEGQLMRHEKALQNGGVYDLAAIRRGFKGLESLSPHLKSYCKTFYWTMVNYFEAYRSLSTGLFQGNIKAEITTKEKTGVQVAKKGAQYAAEVLKSIPVVGSAVGLLDMLIDDITGMIGQNRFEKKVDAIMIIIKEKFQMVNDISTNIAKLALAVTYEREKDILHPASEGIDSSIIGKMGRLKNGFEKKLMALKMAILPTIDLNDPEDPAVQLALKDVTLTLSYLIKKYEEVAKSTDPLDVQMITIVRNGELEKLLPEPSSQPTSNSFQATNNNSNKKDQVSNPQPEDKKRCVLM